MHNIYKGLVSEETGNVVWNLLIENMGIKPPDSFLELSSLTIFYLNSICQTGVIISTTDEPAETFALYMTLLERIKSGLTMTKCRIIEFSATVIWI